MPLSLIKEILELDLSEGMTFPLVARLSLKFSWLLEIS